MNVLKLNSRNRRAGKKPLVATFYKLDLGCGPNKKAGFTGVDKHAFPGVDIVGDLNLKWPFADNSVEEAHCSHTLEHFTRPERCHFMNELFRVMKVGAKCTLICPAWQSCRAYGDPTHEWPPVSEFFFYYLRKEWRMSQAPHTDKSILSWGLDCDFDVVWGHSLHGDLANRNTEYQTFALTWYKEAGQDIIATLTKK